MFAAGTKSPSKIALRPESFTLGKIRTKSLPLKFKFKFIEHIGRDISIVGSVVGQKSSIRVIIPAEERHKVKEEVVTVYPKTLLHIRIKRRKGEVVYFKDEI